MRRVRSNDESGNNFDRHFRERLRNSEVEPSGNLWDRIGYKLDQEREKIKYNHWYYALLILLVPLAIANIYTNYDLEDYHSSLLKESKYQRSLLSEDASSRSFENSLLPFPADCSYSDNDDHGANLSDPLVGDITLMPDFNNILFRDDNSILLEIGGFKKDPIKSATASIDEKLTRTEIESLDRKLPIENMVSRAMDGQEDLIKNPLSALKGFHFGFDFGTHRNWFVFRKDVLNPLIVGDVEIQQLRYGTQYGISLGYDFSHKFGLEVEGVFRSAQGFKFQESRYNGKLIITGELDLNYMHIPVLFKYKWSKISARTFNPKVLNLLAGIQYSRLKSVDYTSDWSDFEVPDDMFNKNELGVTLGLEYDIFLHKNYYLSIGARGTFLSDAGSFPYFNPNKSGTYNYLVGLNVSINYHVGKKQRGK